MTDYNGLFDQHDQMAIKATDMECVDSGREIMTWSNNESLHYTALSDNIESNCHDSTHRHL